MNPIARFERWLDGPSVGFPACLLIAVPLAVGLWGLLWLAFVVALVVGGAK